jgi:hypothetical protein
MTYQNDPSPKFGREFPPPPRNDSAPVWIAGGAALIAVLGLLVYSLVTPSSPPTAAVPPATVGSGGSPVR